MSTYKTTVGHYTESEAKVFGPEAPGTRIRVLINDENDGAPIYNMRMIEIEPNGHSPHHSHPYEHENFVIEGQGELIIEGEHHMLRPGSIAFVPPNVRHQYRNAGDTVLKFLCSVPVEKLRPVV